ncbi:hypothetical protein CANINC_005037 [Pichia inconspicua]|uniref:Phosphotransferase n=1 Tax=Pichia inconspicua TaxID=52247 RepID=A0A4T0WUL0_9ASCO|nr:hypothetical protein CANINC_005037 [[Candida] inconspicua]
MLSPIISDNYTLYNSERNNYRVDEKVNVNTAQQIERINRYFQIEQLKQNSDSIRDGFQESILLSLRNSKNCMLPCFNTIADESIRPEGSIIVIDIGGSTLRICIVQFEEGNTAICKVNRSWTIHDSNKHFSRSFFGWVINKFRGVIDTNDELLKNASGRLRVGITWSFPIIQNKSARNGIVSDLGKGFSISDEFRGEDLKVIFETCFDREGIQIEVCSIVNDSASVLISGSYFNNSKIALVQGTGMNSSFLIDSSYLSRFKRTVPGESVIINSEASFLGYHLFKYITPIDLKLNSLWEKISDYNLEPPHMTTSYGVFQPLELLTAGRYIPELVRLMAIEIGVLKMLTLYTEPYSLTGENLIRFYNKDLLVKVITDAVIERASIVLVAYLKALLRVLSIDTNTNYTTGNRTLTEISVVGSMLQYFPGYRARVEALLPPTVTLTFLQDSSIYGAAIAAYVNEARM